MLRKPCHNRPHRETREDLLNPLTSCSVQGFQSGRSDKLQGKVHSAGSFVGSLSNDLPLEKLRYFQSGSLGADGNG